MPRKRTANPNPRKAKTPDAWWDVEYMDVEVHVSKSSGNTSIRVDYAVDEELSEWPVSEWFSPDSPNEFARKRWRKFCTDMEAHGHRPGGKSLEAIVELSEHWLMPEKIGVCREIDGEYENIRIVALDWGTEEEKEDSASESQEEETTGLSNRPMSGPDAQKDENDLPF